MLAETFVAFGANLFVWIVGLLIALVAALSFVDNKKNADK